MTCWTVTVALAALLIARPIAAAAAVLDGAERNQLVMQMRTGKLAHCPQLPSSPLYRFVNPDTERSRYSLDPLSDNDDEYADGAAGRVFARAESATVPLYHLFNPTTQDSMYTRTRGARRPGYFDMGVAAHVFPARRCGGVPLYRLVKAGKGGDNHFYTANEAEREVMLAEEDFVDAGIVGYLIQGKRN